MESQSHLWCVYVCVLSVCWCPFPLPPLTLMNGPHSRQGSDQITEWSCRQPAAWVANKCHFSIERGTRGRVRGTDGENMEEEARSGLLRIKCTCCRPRGEKGQKAEKKAGKLHTNKWVNKIKRKLVLMHIF